MSVIKAILSGALLAGLAAAPAVAQDVAQGYPESYKDIVAAAKTEGKVVIYSTANSPNTKAVWADFQSMYPGVEIELTDLSTTELYNRYLAQVAAGDHSVDILWSNAMDLQMKLVQDGHAMTYASQEKAALPEWGQYKDMLYSTTVDPVVLVYNKKLVPADLVPKSHDDLAKMLNAHADQFRGKIASYDVATTGSAYVNLRLDLAKWPGYWISRRPSMPLTAASSPRLASWLRWSRRANMRWLIISPIPMP